MKKPIPSNKCQPHGCSVWEWKKARRVLKGHWSLLVNKSASSCCCVRPEYPAIEPEAGTLTLTRSVPAKNSGDKKSRANKSKNATKKKKVKS